MKKLALALAFAACTADPVYAQPTLAQLSRKIDSLSNELDRLRRDVGPYGDSVPPSANFALHCPSLPNSRYSVWCRVQQIGLGIDANNVAVAELSAKVNNMPSSVEPVPGPPGPPGPAGPPGAPANGGVVVTATSALLINNPPEITFRNEGVAPGFAIPGFNIGEFMSRNDNGWRLQWNWCTQPGNPYESYCDPYKPQAGIAIEQDGVISFGGRKPFSYGAAGAWDYPRNSTKAFVIQPAGYNCDPTNFCDHVWIGVPAKGRSVEIGTNDANDSNSDARNSKIRINGDSRPNPVQIFMGGKLVTLVPCPSSQYVCWQ